MWFLFHTFKHSKTLGEKFPCGNYHNRASGMATLRLLAPVAFQQERVLLTEDQGSDKT